VRSFKSFIRTAPPHSEPDGNKPLPPTPTSATSAIGPDSNIFAQSAQTASDQENTTFALRPPTVWHDLSYQTSPFSTTRHYVPLLPEPSPGIPDGPEPRSWPFTSSNLRHSNLASIDERAIRIPSPPPHQLYAFSGGATNIAMKSSNLSPPGVPSNTESPNSSSKVSVEPNLDNAQTSPPSDPVLRVSNLTTKQKAFASLGIDTNDQYAMQEHWFGAQPIGETLLNLSMRGKKLQPPSRPNPKPEEPADDTDASKNMQRLSVSQDYHNDLADKYHEAYVFGAEHSTLEPTASKESGRVASKNRTSNEHAMTPRPLSWRENLGSPVPSNCTSNSPTNGSPNADIRRRYSRRPSWPYVHKRTQISERSSHSDTDRSLSTSVSPVPIRKQNSEPVDSQSKKMDMHFPDIIPQVKNFMSNTKRPRVQNTATSGSTSSKGALKPRPPPIPSSLGMSIPSLHLPGGLSIARQSPEPASPPRSTSASDISHPLESKHWKSQSDFSGYGYPSKRRPSLYREQSYPPVAPAVAINQRLGTSIGSVPSLGCRSNISSPPISPLAHEIALPHTPSPLPQTPPPLSRAPKPPPTFSPWSEKSAESIREDCVDSATEAEPHRRSFHVGIFDRARAAREAWKKHKRDANHTKLKQSIRILGPTDPVVAAEFVRRGGRMPVVNCGVTRSRMPGYMVAGPI
jgi:hypothetical protein